MKIKILSTIRGPEISYDPNDVVNVDSEFGEALVSVGAAEAIIEVVEAEKVAEILEDAEIVEAKSKKRR